MADTKIDDPTMVEEVYLQYMNDIAIDLMKESSVFSTMVGKLVDEFNRFGLTNEEKAKALSQIYSQEIDAINANASQTAMQLIEMEDKLKTSNLERLNIERQICLTEKQCNKIDEEVETIRLERDKIQAQIALLEAQRNSERRKQRGYDDNLSIEVAKASGNLASFAVNANSDSAQDAINTFKEKMSNAEGRICDTPSCPDAKGDY